jgi:hypothetical protein
LLLLLLEEPQPVRIAAIMMLVINADARMCRVLRRILWCHLTKPVLTALQRFTNSRINFARWLKIHMVGHEYRLFARMTALFLYISWKLRTWQNFFNS